MVFVLLIIIIVSFLFCTLVFFTMNASVLNVIYCMIAMLSIIAFIVLFCSLAGRLFGRFIRRFRYVSKHCRLGLLILFCFWVETVLFLLVSGSVLNVKVRRHIKNTIDNISVDGIILKIDGEEIETKEYKRDIIEGVRNLGVIDHKGGRRDQIQCEISVGKEQLYLILSRNSINSDSFVVYYPKYWVTKLNVIGGFYSDSTFLNNLFPVKNQEEK